MNIFFATYNTNYARKYCHQIEIFKFQSCKDKSTTLIEDEFLMQMFCQFQFSLFTEFVTTSLNQLFPQISADVS